VILILDCDVPWINTRCKPNPEAKIYHVDVDPLKQQIPVFYVDALARFKADSSTAIQQINSYIESMESIRNLTSSSEFDTRWTTLKASHAKFLERIEQEAKVPENGDLSTAFLCNQLRKACPKDTIWCIEAVTQTLIVADQIQASIPGSWINCGGGGLGWSGGGKIAFSSFLLLIPVLTCTAALGIKLATDKKGNKKFVCQIVGGKLFHQSHLHHRPLTPFCRRHIPLQHTRQRLLGRHALQHPRPHHRPQQQRLERTPQFTSPRAPRRCGIKGDQRRAKHLVHADARLRRYRESCGGRETCGDESGDERGVAGGAAEGRGEGEWGSECCA
jgi:hypothetical protein